MVLQKRTRLTFILVLCFQTDPVASVNLQQLEVRADLCAVYLLHLLLILGCRSSVWSHTWPKPTTASTLNPTAMIRDTKGSVVNKLTLDPFQSLLVDSYCKLCGIIAYYTAFCGTCSCIMHHICLINILHAYLVVCSSHKHIKGDKWESLECVCVCVCVCDREKSTLRCRSSERGRFWRIMKFTDEEEAALCSWTQKLSHEPSWLVNFNWRHTRLDNSETKVK